MSPEPDGPRGTERGPAPPLASGEMASADDRFAADLRGFGGVGIVAMLLILLTGNITVGPLALPVGATLIVLWARRSRTPWRELGFGRPRSWVGSVAVGIVFGITFKFFMKAIVLPLLGADPINHAYHYLEGNRAVIPATLFSMVVTAGVGEEIVFRGYMFERFGKLLGSSPRAKVATVLITAAWFGIGHLANQGLTGAEQATIVGLVYGTIYAITGRLWMLMCAHAAFDLTAYAMIYWGLETRVAHLVFK
jgi:membrane protease YdiL (CAAX protease family)